MKQIMHGRRRRRGAYLGICIVVFPVVMALFLVALTREDVALRETQRREQRLQARLLAESALVLEQATGQVQAGRPLAGELEGAGEYRLEIVAENPAPDADPASGQDTGQLLRAVGEVRGHNRRVNAEIKVRVQADGGADARKSKLQPLTLTYAMDHIEPWVNEDTPPEDWAPVVTPTPIPAAPTMLTPSQMRTYMQTGQLPPGVRPPTPEEMRIFMQTGRLPPGVRPGMPPIRPTSTTLTAEEIRMFMQTGQLPPAGFVPPPPPTRTPPVRTPPVRQTW